MSGQMLLRTVFLSLDPYMRGRMNDGKSYATSFQLDQPMTGGAIGEVIESRMDGFSPGDLILHMGGWRDGGIIGLDMSPNKLPREALGPVPTIYVLDGCVGHAAAILKAAESEGINLRRVGTTKSTIEQIRDRTHWNSANLTPMDPVTLGLCSQIDLDLEVEKASKGRPLPTAAELGATLQSASETENVGFSYEREEEKEIDANAVFAKLQSLKSDRRNDDEDDQY